MLQLVVTAPRKAPAEIFISSGCLSRRLIRKNMREKMRHYDEKISDYF
ncbi:hypothetical protein GSH00_11300 [Burkholderia pseudomallei]|nr:hypothetical protein [Burkholderia pseudomallei]QBI40509.1 hypothetical protein EXY28_12230 [Burkholderia pseudomallei]QBI47190.1 hypothetical protein EXY72_12285 [Burkholderia pseudomallei]QBP48947.1 hypothetical protein E2R28_12200 [Burkholderia pseudomallei]QBP68857.1 hypothetical protein E2R25_12215 [Burkholderia pseudomallei]